MLATLLNAVPTPVTLLVGALFILHYRSWPFYWHLRMLYPFMLVGVRFLFYRGTRRKWMDSASARGASPFDAYTVYHGWAGFDDCDYNMHISNSCYAKNFDYSRIDYMAQYLLPYALDGGAPALAHSQFHYLREIPLGRRYEVRTSVAGWDDKRIHMMARFITRKTAADKKRERARAAGASGTSTPVPANDSSSVPVGAARASVPFASDARIDDAEWTTHAVCVASYVCKHASSRRTLPPALVLAASGFGLGGTTDAWEKMQDIRYGPKKALRKFWSGGWAEGERWWEDLAGVWEAQRAAAARELSGTKA